MLPRAPRSRPSAMGRTPATVPPMARDPIEAPPARPTAPPVRGPRSLPLHRGVSAIAITMEPKPQPSPASPRAAAGLLAAAAPHGRSCGPMRAPLAAAANQLWRQAQRRGIANGMALPPGPSKRRRSADECGRYGGPPIEAGRNHCLGVVFSSRKSHPVRSQKGHVNWRTAQAPCAPLSLAARSSSPLMARPARERAQYPAI